MRPVFIAALVTILIAFAVPVFAGDTGPPVKPPEEKKLAGEEKSWTPPSEEEIARLEKRENKKLEAKLKRWRQRMENAGMQPGEIERKLHDAKKQWKREMAFRIALVKLPPGERNEAVIERRLKAEQARLEREGLYGESLEKELAEARDRIEMELEEQRRIDAMPPRERIEYMLDKQEAILRERFEASGLEGEELEGAVKSNLEFYREELEAQHVEKKEKPKPQDAGGGKTKLARDDLKELQKLQKRWKEEGLPQEEIKARSAQWKRRRLLEKSNPALAVINALKKEMKALEKQLKAANRRLKEVNELVKKQSEEIAALRKMLEEIRRELLGPGWDEPPEPKK
ncbi:MAG: hypothetical protein ACYS8W_05115 [Planctomycetota bacterium]|jgi:hypothetical protein